MAIYINARFLTQPITGVQRYAYEVAKVLKDIDKSIHFLSPKNIKQHEWAEELKPIIVGNSIGYWWEQVTLPKYLSKKNNPVLLNLCNLAPMFYKNNYITIHDLAYVEYPNSFKPYIRFLYSLITQKTLQNAQFVFTVSDISKNKLVQHFPLISNKIAVSYNGISSSLLQFEKQNINKQKIILSVGSFHSRKNHQMLIDAFLESKMKDEYKLVIITNKDSFFNEIEALKPDSNIAILLDVPDSELVAYYQKSSYYFSASIFEGFNLPVLEALYFNCKVLCHELPLYKELYGDLISTVNFKNKQRVIEKLNNFADIKTLTETQKNAVFDKYNYSKSAKIIYEHIISKNNK